MRVAILGNSGSGKSVLARRLAAANGAEVLDLDTVAWEPGKIAVARDGAQAAREVEEFCSARGRWVVEGCYASLVGATLRYGPHLLFLDPGTEVCLANCRSRPWEAHKYPSKEAQDERLDFLLAWVAEYDRREGDLSRRGHEALFAGYGGPKRHLRALPDADFSLTPAL